MTADAKKIAEGLQLPCPLPYYPDEVYVARAFKFCTDTVRGAFPIWSTIFPKIPTSACNLAVIQEKAAGVIAGAQECKG